MIKYGCSWLFGVVIWIAALAWAGATSAQQPPPPSGPAATVWTGNGLSLEIAPLAIEPAAAFFLNRGFSYEQALVLSRTGCIFRSAIGHSEKNPDASCI